MTLRNICVVSLIWAVLGNGIAVLVWSVLTGSMSVFHYYLDHPTLVERLLGVPWAIITMVIWASFVTLLAIPGYFAIFAAYIYLTRMFPRAEESARNRFLSAAVLALPAISLLFIGYGMGGGFDWGRALSVLPYLVICCVSGTWLPRLIFRPLAKPLLALTSSISHA